MWSGQRGSQAHNSARAAAAAAPLRRCVARRIERAPSPMALESRLMRPIMILIPTPRMFRGANRRRNVEWWWQGPVPQHFIIDTMRDCLHPPKPCCCTQLPHALRVMHSPVEAALCSKLLEHAWWMEGDERTEEGRRDRDKMAKSERSAAALKWHGKRVGCNRSGDDGRDSTIVLVSRERAKVVGAAAGGGG